MVFSDKHKTNKFIFMHSSLKIVKISINLCLYYPLLNRTRSFTWWIGWYLGDIYLFISFLLFIYFRGYLFQVIIVTIGQLPCNYSFFFLTLFCFLYLTFFYLWQNLCIKVPVWLCTVILYSMNLYCKINNYSSSCKKV